MTTKKYYAVKKGLKTGIFPNWNECNEYVKGYPGAEYKSFKSLSDAQEYLGCSSSIKAKIKNKDTKPYKLDKEIINSETKNYYVVRKGKKIGIFLDWNECEKQVKGYPGAEYKKILGKTNAINFLKEGNIKVTEETEKKVKRSIKDISKKDKIGYDVESINSIAKVKVSTSFIDPNIIKDDFKFIAFTDGSYDKNKKAYGSGVISLKNNLVDYDIYYSSGYDKFEQWNIAGEIEAVKLAIKKAEELGHKSIAIYHDLKNISLWACGKWKARNVYTKEYVRFIEEYSNKMNIYFIKVKGHSTESKYNDLADEAAREALCEI